MCKKELSTEVFEFLNGKQLSDKQHEAMMLMTVGEDGWPHNAMISVGEIVALNCQELRIGLWPNTTTASNIIRTQKATLVMVCQGKVHYIRLSLKRLDKTPDSHYVRERFSAQVVLAREDVAKYAQIISGINIDLFNEKEVIERWEQTVKEMKE